ncbi:MAG: cell wall hydrolase [Roseburia sp.]|nr:cell wall hydrolase [Roseburia sp.]
MEGFMSLRNKAVKNAVTVALGFGILCAIAGTASITGRVNDAASQQVTIEDSVKGRTAGVVLSLNELEELALTEVQKVEYAQLEMVVVTAAEEAIASIPDGPILTEEEQLWQNRVMADVEDKMNVRAEASKDSEIVGRMRKGDVAEVVEIGEEWTHIKSGNVDGYVKNEYCVYGLDALAYANTNIDIRATITGTGIRVRSEASTDSSIVASVSKGTVLIVEPDAEQVDGWLAVRYTGKTRYISADYAEVTHATTEAITIAEEKEIARKKAEEEAKRRAAQTTEITVVQNASFNASTDEVLLLAALIQCEAGGECYEGKVAVGAAVMNRVRSGRYPNSITEVIYAPGQFSPAGNGKVASVVANGPKASCIQAAQEAINGVDNTNGAISFRLAKSGHAGLVIGNHVFF